jgi:hypothetical protein
MSRSAAIVLTVVLVAANRPRPAAQGQAPDASAKTPKMPVNVQVLKGLTLKEVRAEMDIVAASLGVKCENCHIKGDFPNDTKPDKPVARKMLAMTKDINTRFAEQFKDVDKSPSKLGKVTCFTCHNGAKEPKNVPPDIADSQ